MHAEARPLRPWHPEAFARVPVTTTFLVVLGAVFALELAWGGAETTETLVRMGAWVSGVDVPCRPARVLAYGVLHIGLAHIAVNSFSLWNLGLALEPLLGRALFTVLLFGSVLAGGVGIAAFGTGGVTAGASGGLFGLLAAVAVLLYVRSRAVSHPYERAAIRNQLAMLVVPNLLISLLPGVSLAGHGAGAAFGLAFMGALRAAGPLRPGSPRAATVLSTARTLALALVLATATSVAAVWWTMEPWAPSADPAWLEGLGAP